MKSGSAWLLAAALLVVASPHVSAADDYLITTVAGTGERGYAGDGGAATRATFAWKWGWGLCVDSSDCLYIIDSDNNRIRKVDASGRIATVAGNGAFGASGDGGPATEASLKHPCGIDLDKAGNLYIGDQSARVRKVDASGIITTVAGIGAVGHTGDGGPATAAKIWGFPKPRIDHEGNLYILDSGEHQIRRVDRVTGIITTVAGTGRKGFFSGDGGPAIKADLWSPSEMCFDRQGNMYVVDSMNQRIRRVDAAGIITTVAGGGNPGEEKEGGPATKADLWHPDGVSFDGDGNLWLTDTGRHRIMKVDAAGNIWTIAGTGGLGYAGDGGPASKALLNLPANLRFAADGSIYFLDWGNYVVRKLYLP